MQYKDRGHVGSDGGVLDYGLQNDLNVGKVHPQVSQTPRLKPGTFKSPTLDP